MSRIQTILWHFCWALVVCVVAAWVWGLKDPVARDMAVAGVAVLWVFLTAHVWHRRVTTPPHLRAAEDIPEAERVDIATRTWDALGHDNAGRRYRKKLFKPYLEDLGVNCSDAAIARSRRRQEKKRRKKKR